MQVCQPLQCPSCQAQQSGQTSSMREGIDSSRPRQFSLQNFEGKLKKQPMSREISEIKLKRLLKSVKGSHSWERETRNFSKAYSSTCIPLIYSFHFELIKMLQVFKNTATYWFVWSIVTRVRQPDSVKLTASYLTFKIFAHAQTLADVLLSTC